MSSDITGRFPESLRFFRSVALPRLHLSGSHGRAETQCNPSGVDREVNGFCETVDSASSHGASAYSGRLETELSLGVSAALPNRRAAVSRLHASGAERTRVQRTITSAKSCQRNEPIVVMPSKGVGERCLWRKQPQELKSTTNHRLLSAAAKE